MTKKQRKRRTEIIRQLSELSKDSWSKARYEDYAPLETELNRINERLAAGGSTRKRKPGFWKKIHRASLRGLT